MFHIKKNISLLLAVLCITTMLAGCKIELPNKASSQVHSELSSTTENSASLSQPESEADSAVSSGKATSANSTVASSKSASSKPMSNSTDSKAAGGSTSTQKSSVPAENKPLTCTLMISCKTLLNHMDQLNEAQKSIIPASGILCAKHKVEFKDGDTVFDVLKHEKDAGRLRFEYQVTPVYNSVFLTSINGLEHIQTINNSGWKYCINSTFLNTGCSLAKLKNGDNIEWHYTCDYLGRDLK